MLLVIAPERFRDEEYREPLQALTAAGHQTLVASTRRGRATGVYGLAVHVDVTVATVHESQVDALLVVGGPGAPDHLWDHEPLRLLGKALYTSGKVVTAICFGPPVLARAGALTGRRATTFPTARALAELKRAGATYVRQAVVRDGPVITASGPEAARPFAAAILELLPP